MTTLCELLADLLYAALVLGFAYAVKKLCIDALEAEAPDCRGS